MVFCDFYGVAVMFCGFQAAGADPDKNMTFSKPIMTDMPRPFPGNAQEIDFSVLGV